MKFTHFSRILEHLKEWHIVLFNFNATNELLRPAIKGFQDFLVEFTFNLGEHEDRVLLDKYLFLLEHFYIQLIIIVFL